ncbi:small conserved membrane protein [Lentilactobacillus diolivorans DSM 14421]|uniref:Small conserved membrane protein n=1 Tax=Lentilactobacillus diolivorans DSM 14421 TaxID=1423739 RepID=A0A0R1SGJ4_9LACO|nr:small conserved membrane protein [Lentilactobacillus diolivorans DSM 14421]
MEAIDVQNQLRNPQNPLKKQVQEQLHKKQIDEVKLVGDFATIANLAMYISYLGEIIANLNGQPTSPIQPLFAALNATLWVGYGWLMPKKDWRLIIASFPGVIFGVMAAVTAMM